MKYSLLIILLPLLSALHLRPTHQYWYLASKKKAETNVPYADVGWNYCDYKCLYLEELYPNIDFYIVNFKDTRGEPKFAACYAKPTGGTPKLWNKVADNTFFETNCGGDTEDYMLNDTYKQVSEEGVGIGTLISY